MCANAAPDGGVCSRMRAGLLTISPAEAEIVVATGASKATRFAAEELRDLLGQRWGVRPPLSTAATRGKKSIHVGDSAFVRASGIDVRVLKRDGFRIKTTEHGVCIAGRDDPDVDAFRRVRTDGVSNLYYERGTLFGVYEFLERFAGMRFYFPGELGTVVPQGGALTVPETDLTDAPDFTVRKVSFFWDGEQTVPTDPTIAGRHVKTLNCYRQRFQTEEIVCSHGQNEFRLTERFGEAHPEYLQLLKDGSRCRATDSPQGCVYCRQLCQSSKIWDEMYLDIVSYLRGEPASVRKIPHWRASSRARGEFAWGLNFQRTHGGVYVDVMPQDGMKPCFCEACQESYAKAPDPRHPASELVWGRTAALANRLKAEGHGVSLVQMAYGDYRAVPAVALPDNILVMLAARGPWSADSESRLAGEMDEMRAWNAKLGHKVWLWNYPCKVACGNNLFPDVAPMAPRAYAHYYRSIRDLVIGAYAESNCDRWIFNYLNYYVFGKVAWNNETDADALIAEHHRLMFGEKAAPHMAKFYDMLERKWVRETVGNVVDSAVGPVTRPPSDNDMWFRVYSPETLAELDGFLNAAEAATSPGSIEARRVAFIRANFHTPLATRAAAYVEAHDVRRVLARQAQSGAVNLVEPGGWYGGNPPLSPEATLLGVPSIRLVSSKDCANAYYVFGNGAPQLKPNTVYRFSYFVRCSDLKPLKGGWGGATANWATAGRIGWVPDANYPNGTTDWQYFETTFTTGETTRGPTRAENPGLVLRIRNAVGTAYFAGVRLEEID